MRHYFAPALLALAVCALLAAPQLRADGWDFVSNSNGLSGTFTTGTLSNGQATITGITGFWDGEPIAGLLAPGTFLSNDNVLFYPGPQFLDQNGVGFVTNVGTYVDVCWNGSSYKIEITHNLSDPNSYYVSGPNATFAVTPAAVPEPGTMILLGSGLLGMGAILRRRSKRDGD